MADNIIKRQEKTMKKVTSSHLTQLIVHGAEVLGFGDPVAYIAGELEVDSGAVEAWLDGRRVGVKHREQLETILEYQKHQRASDGLSTANGVIAAMIGLVVGGGFVALCFLRFGG